MNKEFQFAARLNDRVVRSNERHPCVLIPQSNPTQITTVKQCRNQHAVGLLVSCKASGCHHSQARVGLNAIEVDINRQPTTAHLKLDGAVCRAEKGAS